MKKSTKKPNPWSEFVGERVFVRWLCSAFDWPYFFVEEGRGERGALLRGIDFPNGSAKHDGSKFVAKWDEVEEISLVTPDSSYSELIENPGVLDKAQKLVDGRDKQDHYGPPEDFMRRLAKMWGGYLDQELKPTDAAMMMALLKAARLRTNPDHEDSLVDFAGYCRIYERVKGGGNAGA